MVLDFILSELEVVDKEQPICYQNRPNMVNFQRRKIFSKAIQHIQTYQSTPYNLHAIGVSRSVHLELCAVTLELCVCVCVTSGDAEILRKPEGIVV